MATARPHYRPGRQARVLASEQTLQPGGHSLNRPLLRKGIVMSIGTILLIILILILIGVFPTWGHSRSWGYAPSGVTGLIIVVLLILLLTGRI